jgi:hypothetical protein
MHRTATAAVAACLLAVGAAACTSASTTNAAFPPATTPATSAPSAPSSTASASPPAVPATPDTPTAAQSPSCGDSRASVLLGGELCMTPTAAQVTDNGYTDQNGNESYTETVTFTVANVGTALYTSSSDTTWVANEPGQQSNGQAPGVELAPGDARDISVAFDGEGITEVIFADPNIGSAYWYIPPQYATSSPTLPFQ